MAVSRLDDDTRRLVGHLWHKQIRAEKHATLLGRYRDGQQRLRQMGLAVPPELRMFETVVNIPGMAVREPVMRQELRAFQRSGALRTTRNPEGVDRDLQEAWDFNNMASQSMLAHMDARTYGRAFVSVSENPEGPDQPPVIMVEPPASFAILIDESRMRIQAALRCYTDRMNRVRRATLYTPGRVTQLSRDNAGDWTVEDVVTLKADLVPIVMLINRPWSNRFKGLTEMSDVIGMTDSIARMITNMQVAGETLALPHRWATGVDPKEFFDDEGNPTPVWESYLTVLRATSSETAKFGSFATADLDNFNKAVNNMMAWCGAVLGLPTRDMGQQTVNPAAEGAIIADEIRLIKNVETMNRYDGDAWAWVMELWQFARTGEQPGRNSIRALWHNPATPTYSQRADAIVKMMSGTVPVLSREGAWDELGWTEERKQREREYFAAQQADPLVALAADVMSGTTNAASGN